MDFKTERQKKLDKRNEEIAADFIVLKSEYSDQKNYAICRKLSEKYNITPCGVVAILKKKNVI